MKNRDELQKQMLDILNDTVKYYSKDPIGRRAKQNGACVYVSKSGKKCAVGRQLNQKDLGYLKRNTRLSSCLDNIWESLHSRKVKSLPKDFWERLQRLHDASYNWDKTSISKEGKEMVKNIKTWIKSTI